MTTPRNSTAARRILTLALLALLAAPPPVLAQLGGGGMGGGAGGHGHRQGNQQQPSSRSATRGPVPPTPEVWPRLEDGAVLCKTREDLVRFQTQLTPSAAAPAKGAAPACRTLEKRTGIQILDHDGPSRTQVVTTDDAKETGWTNSYLPATPPPAILKTPAAEKSGS